MGSRREDYWQRPRRLRERRPSKDELSGVPDCIGPGFAGAECRKERSVSRAGRKTAGHREHRTRRAYAMQRVAANHHPYGRARRIDSTGSGVTGGILRENEASKKPLRIGRKFIRAWDTCSSRREGSGTAKEEAAKRPSTMPILKADQFLASMGYIPVSREPKQLRRPENR